MIYYIIDFISASILLTSLYLVTKNRRWWLLYAFACLSYAILFLFKRLYFGSIMDIVAVIIALKNANIVSSVWCTCKRPQKQYILVKTKNNKTYFVCVNKKCFKPIQNEEFK